MLGYSFNLKNIKYYVDILKKGGIILQKENLNIQIPALIFLCSPRWWQPILIVFGLTTLFIVLFFILSDVEDIKDTIIHYVYNLLNIENNIFNSALDSIDDFWFILANKIHQVLSYSLLIMSGFCIKNKFQNK